MPLTLADALAAHRDVVFAPLRAADPSFTVPPATQAEADEAFFMALADHLRSLSADLWAQFVTLTLADDLPALDRFLRQHTEDADTILRKTLTQLAPRNMTSHR
jgi:hypothetical protein